MNLKEQQYVCTLAQCQNLTRAAEELYISPSALSVYISNLERHLGTPLFERTGKAFVLTAIGEAYVVRARKMLEMKAEFDELLKSELQKSHPTIRVGIQQRRAIAIVPEVLKRFMLVYPDVDVIFRDGTLSDLTQMYKDHRVDLLVSIFQEALPDAICEELATEKVLVALPDTHPANHLAYHVEGDTFPHLDVSGLDGETFIVPPAGQSMRGEAEHIWEQNHIHPGRTIEISHFDIIMGMVDQGLGVAFNRLGYIQDMERFRHVRYYLMNREAYEAKVMLVYRKEHTLSTCEKMLIEILKEAVRERYVITDEMLQ